MTVTRNRRSVASGCWRAQEERAVLDRVGELVDHVVGFDDALGGVEVAVEQRLRAAGDRLGGERGEADHVDAELVEVLVEGLARPFGGRAVGEWGGRHDASGVRSTGIRLADLAA